MCKASVQNERARREELHMGVGGCCVAPIGCCFAPYGWWHKFNRERWPGGGVGDVSVQGKCARQACKGGRASYGDGGLLCGSYWLLLCFLWVVAQIQ